MFVTLVTGNKPAYDKKSHGSVVVAEKQSEWTALKAAEARRKAYAATQAAQRDRELAAAATPETLSKARANVTQRMFERGQMGAEQLQAAAEIARLWQAICCSQFARTSRYGAVSGGAAADWPPSLTIAYRERYVPWRTEQGCIVLHGRTHCELVFALAVDNHGPRQAADHFGMDHRTLKNAVCESLYRYAEIGGWIEVRKPLISASYHGKFIAA